MQSLVRLRRFATTLLLIPLLFNGMRMVCVDPPALSAPAVADATGAPADASQTCAESCPLMKHRTETGSTASAKPGDNAQSQVLCVLASTGDGICDAAFGFLVALPKATVTFDVSPALVDTTVDRQVLYVNPSRISSSPPPKA